MTKQSIIMMQSQKNNEKCNIGTAKKVFEECKPEAIVNNDFPSGANYVAAISSLKEWDLLLSL